MVIEQGLLQRPGRRPPPRRVVLEPQGLQPPGLAEGIESEEPPLGKGYGGPKEHGMGQRPQLLHAGQALHLGALGEAAVCTVSATRVTHTCSVGRGQVCSQGTLHEVDVLGLLLGARRIAVVHPGIAVPLVLYAEPASCSVEPNTLRRLLPRGVSHSAYRTPSIPSWCAGSRRGRARTSARSYPES